MKKNEILEMLKNGELDVATAMGMLDALEKKESSKEDSYEESVKADINATPFRSEGNKEIISKEWQNIISLAPFASSKTISKLVRKELDKECDINLDIISSLAPFLDDEDLTELAKLALENETLNVSFLIKIAPFMDSDDLFDIINSDLKGTITMETIKSLAPFLEEEHIDALIEKFLNDLE